MVPDAEPPQQECFHNRKAQQDSDDRHSRGGVVNILAIRKGNKFTGSTGTSQETAYLLTSGDPGGSAATHKTPDAGRVGRKKLDLFGQLGEI
jgi:hypothetical protein